MKSLFSIAIIVCLMVQTISKSLVYFNFKIHQKEIAATLCVKRAEKGNSCHGCCQLKKMMAKQVKDEQKQPDRPTNQKEKLEVLYFQLRPMVFVIPHVADSMDTLPFFGEPNMPISRFSDGVFHPPQSEYL